MIKKCICFILILTLLLFSLTGCYDSSGIEDFYYIVAMGIDKAENNLIKISIQTAKTSSTSDSSTTQSSDYKIYSVDATSIDSGISILNNYLNKKINLSHCSAIIFSEEIARSGLKSIVNLLGNDTEIRPNCNIIISSKKAYDVLNKVSNSGENFSSRLYEYILNSVDYTGYTIDSTFNSFFSGINNLEAQATAIYTIVNDDTIQNSGMAIFRDDVMIGTLSPLQTIAHQILTNNLDSCMITIDSPFHEGDSIDLNLKRIKSPKFDINIVNNTPVITINAYLQATVDSSGANFDYTKEENIEKIENAADEYLKSLLEEYLYITSKNYNCDIVGFGGIASSKYLTADEFNKIHWNEVFKDSLFDVNINTTITSSHLFNKE